MKNKKIFLIIAGVIALVLALGSALWVTNPSWLPIKDQITGNSAEKKLATEKAQQRLKSALQYVPKNSLMVSHANMSSSEGVAQWWKNYTNLLLESVTLPEELPEELSVNSLTFASFPNTGTYATMAPLGWEIVVTTDPDKTLEVVDYIGQHKNETAYVNFIEGDTTGYVIISGVSSYEELGKLATTDSVDGTFASVQEAKDFDVNAKNPSMFVDMSSYLDTYTAMQPDVNVFSEKLISQGLGMEANTIWFGDTKNNGATWEGKFISGGVNKDKVDPEAFTQTLYDEMEYSWGSGGASQQTPTPEPGTGGFDYGYVSLGMSAVGEAFSVSKGDKAVGGVINPHNVESAPKVAPTGSADDETITVVFSPQMFQSVYQGMIDPYSIHTVTVTIEPSGKVSLAFDFYEEDDFANTDPEVSQSDSTEVVAGEEPIPAH